MLKISDYEPIVGKDIIDELRLMSKKLHRKKIQCLNSTKSGGGVAEILTRLIPLLNDLEVNATWDIITADADYFTVPKAFHQAQVYFYRGRRPEKYQDIRRYRIHP